ncbi:MAG: LEPR-XLL domain-containing protein, partial [Verrucomicrobiota bacterium]
MLRKRKKKENSYVPGERFRSKKLAQSLRYNLEPLEPRILLSATLHDPQDGVDGGGTPVAGDPSVATSIETSLENLFTQLGEYGDQLSLDPTVNETALPFFQTTLNDLLGTDVGNLLKGGEGTGSAFATAVDTYFASTTTEDSTGLAAALQSVLDANFSGATNSVTDTGSTDSELVLNFSIDIGEQTKNLAFGDEAQEFFMEMGPNAAVKFDPDAVTFTVKADLTGLDNLTTDEATNDSSTTSDYWVEFGGSAKDTLTISGNSSHSNTLDPLTDYGIGFGLIEARDSVGQSGGYISNTGATFAFNAEVEFIIDSSFSSDSEFTLAEMSGVSDWSTAYTANTPDDGDTSDSTYINSGKLFLPVEVANPAGDDFISGIDGLTGSFTLVEQDAFDDRASLVTASDPTLASLSRLTTDDLLQYTRNAGLIFGQTADTDAQQQFLPLLDLNLGQAYDFLTTVEQALIDPLVDTENVLRVKNAPSTSGDPLDYSGNSQFNIYVFYQGALLSSAVQTVSISSTTRTSLQDIANNLNTALAGLDWSGAGATQRIFARVTETSSPRLEFYGDADTTFFIDEINPSGQTLDLGIEANGLVFARSSTASTGDYQLQEVKVESTSAIEVSNFDTAKTFSIAIGSDAAIDVTLDPDVYGSMADFVLALQSALEGAGLYDGSTDSGVEATAATSTDNNGFGITLQSIGTRAGENLTISGTDAGIFNFASNSGSSSYTSATALELSPLNTQMDLTITMKSQEEGVLSTKTDTVTIPPGNHETVDAFVEAIRTVLQNNGFYDYFTDTGLLVEVVQLVDGQGIRFYGSAEVYEITIQTSSNALLGLAASSETATSAYLDIDVTEDGSGTATTHRVYINGNTTTDLLGEEANSSIVDFTEDFQDAMERAGIRDGNNGTGVDIRPVDDGAGNASNFLELFALNPGSGTGTIQAISTGASASSGLADYYLDGLTSQSMALSNESNDPSFSSVQDFVEVLNTSTGVPLVQVEVITVGSGEGIRISGYSGVTITGVSDDDSSVADSLLNLNTETATEVESDNEIDLSDFTTDRSFDLTINGNTQTITIPGATYANVTALAKALQGAIRDAGFHEGLLSSSAVYNAGNLATGVSPYFDFPIRMLVDSEFGDEGLADLTDVDLRFEDGYGEISTGRVRSLSTDSQVTVSRSTEISFNLGVNLIEPATDTEQLVAETVVIINGWDGQLTYDALFQVIMDDGVVHDVLIEASDTSDNNETQDFVDDINDELAALGLSSLITAELDTVNASDLDVIRFVTAAGVSKSLTIRIPEYINEDVLYTNEAADKLGFTTNVTPSQLPDSDLLVGIYDSSLAAVVADASSAITVINPDFDTYYHV